MAKHCIAIADDNPAFLAAAASYVAGLPDCVLGGTAGSASDALKLVEQASPDVLLLDLGLAPARGIEFLRRLKALPQSPAIIALALFYTPEAAALALAAGAAALIGKEAFVAGLAEVLPRIFAGLEAAPLSRA